jgi:hypothetical protein
MSYARLPALQSRFEVDWIRVRQYCGADAGALPGLEQDYGPTAVKLASLAATPSRDGILVTWETTSEIDNWGFNIYRTDSADGPTLRLNDTMIPSRAPGSPGGAAYAYLDSTVVNGVLYYYFVEDIDIYGQPTRHGPVSAIANGHNIYLPLIHH